jgi:putative membrane protein
MTAKIIDKLLIYRARESKVKSFFISFYVIGLAGMVLPFSFPIFLKLIPLALLLSFFAIFIFQEQKIDLKSILVFAVIFLAGFFVEVIGVNTGAIFGEYWYGKGLGIKLFNTPLMMGINWVLMIYFSSSLVTQLNHKPILSVFLASASMIIYDLVIEQVAPVFDMWSWTGNSVPIQNYIAWFLIAVVFHSLVKLFNINTRNFLAPLIYICQFLFFLILLLFFKFIKEC